MPYVEAYLNAHGQDCVILRKPKNKATKVSMKRSTSAIRVYGAREAHWDGLILPDANLQSGEILQANSMTFLVQSVNPDPAMQATVWFAVRTNTTLIHKREKTTIDKNYNPITCWETINADVPAFGEIVTYELRQQDPGLLEGTRYVFQISKNTNLKELDRIVYQGSNYRVDSIDDVGMEGIARVQVSVDTRTGEDCPEEEED